MIYAFSVIHYSSSMHKFYNHKTSNTLFDLIKDKKYLEREMKDSSNNRLDDLTTSDFHRLEFDVIIQTFMFNHQ